MDESPNSSQIGNVLSEKKCTMIECENSIYSKGMCKFHYGKDYLRNKKNNFPKERCSSNGCNNVIYSKNLCKKHSSEKKICNYMKCNNECDPESKLCSVHKDSTCLFEGCDTKHTNIKYLMCSKHYQKVRRTVKVENKKIRLEK